MVKPWPWVLSGMVRALFRARAEFKALPATTSPEWKLKWGQDLGGNTSSTHGDLPIINGTSRILNWRYLPYNPCIRPIFEAYVREYPYNSYGQTYGTFTYLHFRILKFPLIINVFPCKTTFILDFPWRCLVTREYS